MNLTHHQPIWFKRAKVYADAAWSSASIAAVAGMSCLAFYWTAVAPERPTFMSPAPKIRVTSGEVTKVSAQLNISSSPHVAYRMWLVNSSNQVIYTYPEVVNSEQTPEFGNLLIRVPPQVDTGDYKLLAQVKYLQNPIKTNVLQVELADIHVDNP